MNLVGSEFLVISEQHVITFQSGTSAINFSVDHILTHHQMAVPVYVEPFCNHIRSWSTISKEKVNCRVQFIISQSDLCIRISFIFGSYTWTSRGYFVLPEVSIPGGKCNRTCAIMLPEAPAIGTRISLFSGRIKFPNFLRMRLLRSHVRIFSPSWKIDMNISNTRKIIS